jgi:Undecaprenyl-phosphate galactose phosphotransferase WbaP
VVALEDEQRDLGAEIMRDLALWGAHDVHVIPSIRGVPLYGMDVSHFFSHDVLMIHLRYQLARPLRRACKRSFDIVVSALLLLLLSPLFAVLMYKITRDGGSPFYGHGRIGKGGRKFDCYKFRSMILNSQQVLQEVLRTDPQARAEWERDFKLKNDPRITAVGHFLRRTSLDELPQLWNVLKGDMSLVGPRPIVQAELERYKKDVGFYLLDKPGMTGLWQISGRNDVDYKTRVYFDSWYVKNWSLWTDIVILFKTVTVVLRRDGAY